MNLVQVVVEAILSPAGGGEGGAEDASGCLPGCLFARSKAEAEDLPPSLFLLLLLLLEKLEGAAYREGTIQEGISQQLLRGGQAAGAAGLEEVQGWARTQQQQQEGTPWGGDAAWEALAPSTAPPLPWLARLPG